jgi:PAS domain S-box-containing protein
VASITDYAIFLLDPDGRVATWNEGARRLKGYEPSEIIGEHFSRFYTEEHLAGDFPAHELEIAARAGRFEDEGWRVRKDGTRFWANVVITAVRDENGTLVGYAKVTRDLTQRRRAEDALRATAEELERTNAELERFAGAAAHDLVQPLHTIVGLADVIRERSGDDLDARTLEALGHMKTSGLRLADRVEALLRYARSTREELAVQTVPVAEVLDHVESTLRGSIESRGAVIERDDVLGTVRADPVLLEVVLQNLVENALKFTESAPRVRIGSVLDGAQRRLTISDNGIGIAERDRERVFQLFSRAGAEGAYAGAGMGLALSRQVVERHGGEIGVEPNPGGGSTFWFTLPTTDRLAAP